jgi:hypothetical protein
MFRFVKIISILVLISEVSGCSTVSLEDLKDLDASYRRNLEAIKALQFETITLRSRFREIENTAWRTKLCHEPKLAQFLSDLQAGVPEVCAAQSVESALRWMKSGDAVAAHFSPDSNTTVHALHAARKGQLKELVEPGNTFPSTRFLVLVQPSEESGDARVRAKNLGVELISMIQAELLSKQELPILGPYLLPCRLRSEVVRRFRGPMDAPLPGEPLPGNRRILVWVFKTDC